MGDMRTYCFIIVNCIWCHGAEHATKRNRNLHNMVNAERIGKVLGHKSHAATQMCSRLAHESVRQAIEKAQIYMFAAAGLVVAKKSRQSSIKKPVR